VTSIGPVLLIVIAIAGLAFGQYAAQNALIAQLSGLMGQQTAEFLQTAVASAASKSSDRGDDDWNYHFNSDGLGRLRRNANCVKCDLEGYAQGHHSLAANSRTRCQPRIIAALGFLLMVSLIVSTALMAFVAMATIAREPGGALMFLPEPFRQCSSHVDRRAGRRARNSREQGRLQNHILFWHKNDYRDAEAIGHRT
jgi:membrane protein